jgi:membrane-anchored protein YejM (alkaline phosphatase superfamily)
MIMKNFTLEQAIKAQRGSIIIFLISFFTPGLIWEWVGKAIYRPLYFRLRDLFFVVQEAG